MLINFRLDHKCNEVRARSCVLDHFVGKRAQHNGNSKRGRREIHGTGRYGLVASGGKPCGTPHALYSKPFAFRTVWAAGEERNVTSALAASG
jgi:hypothetical protein